jgi:glycosyltransferase involved in cell wall biosynthesis
MKYERHDAAWLPRFDRLIACTDAHERRLAAAYPQSRRAIVANSVALPQKGDRERHDIRDDADKHLLFVGNLSYRPNIDGIIGFVRDVLPRLHARFGNRVVLRIAGSVPVREIVALASAPGVELIADLPDLAAIYAWTDLAIIPLDAGGGTRIKLLEAFAHGVPVVATTVGAEGVYAQHETHLLIADGEIAFADACSLLLANREYANRLASKARDLVEARYSHDVGVRAIREALAPRQ